MSKISIYVYENNKKNKALFKTIASLGLSYNLYHDKGNMVEQFNTISESKGSVITLAFHNGKPIACFTLEKLDVFYETSFFVREDYRRLGIAGEMLRETIHVTDIQRHEMYSHSSATRVGYRFLASEGIYSFRNRELCPDFIFKEVKKIGIKKYFREKFKQLFKGNSV